jgi:serine/threonine protein kinase
MNLTGQHLGKYELSERLGQGGMAQVYKAYQPTIERYVAIKVMHSHLAESDDFVERFKREARGLGQLRHPHIVSIIDFDVADEYYYMVMDYIAGPTLSDVLQQQGAFTLERSLQVVGQLCDALAYAHERGTIHRDLKPANVMFVDDGLQHPVLTDFGIARLLDETSLTASGALSGTPAYISPEAVKGVRVDGRADIYSLGIILYEMIAGKPPYSGDTSWSVMMQHVNEPPPRLDLVEPDAPPLVVNLIERAMAKEVTDRFQSAAQFRQAIRAAEYALQTDTATDISYSEERTTLDTPTQLEATVVETPVTPPLPTPPTTSPEREPAPTVTAPVKQPLRSRRTLWGLLAGSVLLILLLSLGLAWWSGWFESGLPVAPPPDTEERAAVAPFGLVRFHNLEDGHQLSLWLERVAQPPPDHHYAWWIRADDQRVFYLGPLPYDNGRMQAIVHLDDNLLLNFAFALVTVEADDQPVTTPSEQPAFLGQLDAAYVAQMNQLFVASDEVTGKAYYPAAAEQLGLAIQHYHFVQESLADDDLSEARRHAEHVVNILDGETGEFFGDLDGDGQVQNPGDGVGLRRYLTEAAHRVETAAGSLAPTPLRQAQAAAAVEGLERILDLGDALIDEALRLLATDTVAEAQAPADQMGVYVAELLAGDAVVETDPDPDHTADAHLLALAADRGLLGTAVHHVLSLSDVLLLPGPAHPELPPPAPLAAPDERLGFFYAQPDNRFLLLLDQVPTAPPGSRYALWGHDPGPDRFDLLATFTTSNGLVHLDGQSELGILEEYGRIAITLETAELSEQSRPGGEIVMSGSFDPELVELVLDLTTAASFQEKGPLFGAVEQTGLAVQHADFMRQALANDDLVEARMHAEHVVNILDGTEGEFFGDVDGDGQVQNPGDGVGVRTYLQQLMAEMEAAVSLIDRPHNQEFYAELVSQNAENGLRLTDAAISEALRLVAADTVAEATPIAEATAHHLARLAGEYDEEDEVVVEPLLAEGGLTAATRFVFKLAEVEVVPSLTANR